MDQSAAIWAVLVAAALAANWPYFSERVLLVGPRRAPKNAWWRLLELVLLGIATLCLGFGLESYLGQRQSQGWAFYAAAGFLFITLGFPGFVWRYLRKHRDE
ncbi:MAG: DUF2818 family protein [Paucibacter sp.]|nr:DUF2818 family protein [Roseateles sp.]